MAPPPRRRKWPLSTWAGSAPRRARVATWLVLLVACGNLPLLGDAVRRWYRARPQPWQPESYIARLASLRDTLQPDSRIAYVNLALSDEATRRRDLFLVRYALAPRCVTGAGDQALVLTYGGGPEVRASLGGMTLERDLGNGFALYQRPGLP